MKNLIKKIAQAIFIALGIILIYVFYAPIKYRAINGATFIAFGVGAVLILIGILLDKIIKLYSKKIGKIIISTFCVASIVGLACFGVTLNAILHDTSAEVSDDATILILGCQVRGETPSSPLYNRTMAGVKYLNEHPKAKAVLCGGQGRGESITEAECMRRIMADNGIDESRLFIEDKSTSTDENIAFAKEYLEDNNIVIATSDYHCYRAKMIAKKNGLNADTIPVGTLKKAYPPFYTREVFAVWWQYIM